MTLTLEDIEALEKHCQNNGAVTVGTKAMLDYCTLAKRGLLMVDDQSARIVELEAQVKAAHIAGFNEGIDAAADVVTNGAEAVSTMDNTRFIIPRRDGNLMGITYAPAISKLRKATP